MIRNKSKRIMTFDGRDLGIDDDGHSRSIAGSYYPENFTPKGTIFTEREYKAFLELEWFWKKGEIRNNLNLTAVCDILNKIIDFPIDYVLVVPENKDDLDDWDADVDDMGGGDDEVDNPNLYVAALKAGNRSKYFDMYGKLLELTWDEYKNGENGIPVKLVYSTTEHLEMYNEVLPGFVFMLLNLRDGSLVRRYMKAIKDESVYSELWSVEKELLLAFSRSLWNLNIVYGGLLNELDKLYYAAIQTISDKKNKIFEEKKIKEEKLGYLTGLIKETEADTLKNIFEWMDEAFRRVCTYHKVNYGLSLTNDFLNKKFHILRNKVEFVYLCMDSFYIRKYYKFEKNYMNRVDNAIMQERCQRINNMIRALYPSAQSEDSLKNNYPKTVYDKEKIEAAIQNLERKLGLKTVNVRKTKKTNKPKK